MNQPVPPLPSPSAPVLVVNLYPITITKYKNVEFDEKDVAFLKSRVVGRLLSRDIVFDTLRRLRETWAGMVRSGLAKP